MPQSTSNSLHSSKTSSLIKVRVDWFHIVFVVVLCICLSAYSQATSTIKHRIIGSREYIFTKNLGKLHFAS
jgi:hypothetical protein